MVKEDWSFALSTFDPELSVTTNCFAERAGYSTHVRRRIIEIVKRNEDICSAMLGAMKALEYGVRTLIAVHPDPVLLNHTWQALLSAQTTGR